jgi:peroxiredoxin
MKPLLSLVLVGVASLAFAVAPPRPHKPVPSFPLDDLDGKKWDLKDEKSKIIVFVFLSIECPMANSYIEQLNGIARTYRDRGVKVIGINANRGEDVTDIKAHVKEYRVQFSMLVDPEQVAVAALGARVNPQAFVLDPRRVVRYQGRIDDGYAARLKARTRIGRRDLVEAIDDLLADKPVRVAETTAFGCPIVRERVAKKEGTVTYHRDVLPILQTSCQSCHRPGQVGPFSLMTYAQAVKWAEDIVGETKARRMPPWKPTQRGVFTNERSLTKGQSRTLEAWLEQGTPEGKATDAPPPVKFTDGWKLGKPDLVLEMPSEAVIGPRGRDLFHVVVLPTNLPEDRYISAIEVQPGNTRVVHHTVQIIDTKGRGRKRQEQFQAKQKEDAYDRGPGYHTRMGFGFLPDPSRGLGGWAPGLVPQRLPEGVGQKLPKGADVLLQVHYHRTGKEERDRTKVGLYFQKGVVKSHFQALPVPGLFLRIPPEEKEYRVQTAVRLSEDATLYYLVPHMHLLGKKIELTAQEPGGKEEALITIDEWDYNWQEMYQLKTPRRLPRGTILRVKAVYDNSAENPLNPNDPPRTVRFGEQTTNEMCFVFCGVSTATPGFPKFAVLPFTR